MVREPEIINGKKMLLQGQGTKGRAGDPRSYVTGGELQSRAAQ